MRHRLSEREWGKSKSLPAAPFRWRNRGGDFLHQGDPHPGARTPSDPDGFLRTRAFHESFANSLPFGGEDTIFSARAGKFQNYEYPASNGNLVSRLKSKTFLPLSTATLLTRACPLYYFVVIDHHCSAPHESKEAWSGRCEFPADRSVPPELRRFAYRVCAGGKAGVPYPMRTFPLSVTLAGSARTGGNCGVPYPIRTVPLSSIAGCDIFTAVISFTVFSNIWARIRPGTQNLVWLKLGCYAGKSAQPICVTF